MGELEGRLTPADVFGDRLELEDAAPIAPAPIESTSHTATLCRE